MKLQGMKEGNLDYMMYNISKFKDTGSRKALQKGIDTYSDQARKPGVGFSKNYQDKLVEMSNYWQIMADSSKQLENAMANSLKLSSNTNVDDNSKKAPLQKAEEEYYASLKNYQNQLDAGAITQDKYNEGIDNLNADTVVKLGGILGKSADANKTYATALLGTLNPRVTESAKIQSELSKVEQEYKETTDIAKSKLDKKLISEDEYRKAIIDAATAATNSAISIKGIGDAADKFIKELKDKAASQIAAPVLGKRDTTFDYKKSKVDILGEELDVAKKLRDDLKDAANEAGVTMTDELNRAMQNVDSLEDALKIAQVIEDVKRLKKELSEGVYSGVKDIASSADRLVSSFKNLDEVFDPESEADGWERLMAVWNAMTNVVDSFLSIIKMIQTLTELTDKLAKAKQAEATVDSITTAQKVSNATVGATAQVAASQATTIAANTEVAANTAKGVSAAGASAASLPFPANLIAIGAAIAAAVALFASIPKFANGGIITGGPSSGDKMLARVNSGEMILNQSQQSRLWQAIQSGRMLTGASSGSKSVTTKVRGKDLLLTINNELKSQGKKTL